MKSVPHFMPPMGRQFILFYDPDNGLTDPAASVAASASGSDPHLLADFRGDGVAINRNRRGVQTQKGLS
ncbi:MAG: hypothetical protein GY869_28655, partial [Planctomycetes bacterium]|nr:hypothetical protein [Planctomycetota bacterium]